MKELRDAIQKLADRGDEVYSKVCTVVEVDEKARTITGRPVDGTADILDVRMQSVLAGENGLYLMPAHGSVVIVSFINPHWAFVSTTSELNRVEIVTERIDLAGTDGEPLVLGTTLNNNIFDLITQIKSLIGDLQTFAATQSAASVGTLAPLQAGFTTLNAALPTINTQLSSLEKALDDHLSEKTYSE